MITLEQKQNIRTAVLSGREKFKGTDTAYAKSLGIDSMAYGQIKDGMIAVNCTHQPYSRF